MNSSPVSREANTHRVRRSFRSRSLVALVAAPAVFALTFVPNQIAGAATQTVTITAIGYVPATSTIATGDSVVFVNGDLVIHQITFKNKGGVTCTPNPLVLQPTASGKCTFQSAGSYSYSDPFGFDVRSGSRR